jgi:hypothetical protein
MLCCAALVKTRVSRQSPASAGHPDELTFFAEMIRCGTFPEVDPGGESPGAFQG